MTNYWPFGIRLQTKSTSVEVLMRALQTTEELLLPEVVVAARSWH